jgi:hypothetical protein
LKLLSRVSISLIIYWNRYSKDEFTGGIPTASISVSPLGSEGSQRVSCSLSSDLSCQYLNSHLYH